MYVGAGHGRWPVLDRDVRRVLYGHRDLYNQAWQRRFTQHCASIVPTAIAIAIMLALILLVPLWLGMIIYA